jgi:hypothetical protein
LFVCLRQANEHQILQSINLCISDIEAQIRDIQEKKKNVQITTTAEEQVALGKTGFYDQDIYDGTNNKFDGYVTSIAANDEIDVCIAEIINYLSLLLIIIFIFIG